jgi:hypothetical protein
LSLLVPGYISNLVQGFGSAFSHAPEFPDGLVRRFPVPNEEATDKHARSAAAADTMDQYAFPPAQCFVYQIQAALEMLIVLRDLVVRNFHLMKAVWENTPDAFQVAVRSMQLQQRGRRHKTNDARYAELPQSLKLLSG